jgi:hypothetical protein
MWTGVGLGFCCRLVHSFVSFHCCVSSGCRQSRDLTSFVQQSCPLVALYLVTLRTAVFCLSFCDPGSLYYQVANPIIFFSFSLPGLIPSRARHSAAESQRHAAHRLQFSALQPGALLPLPLSVPVPFRQIHRRHQQQLEQHRHRPTGGPKRSWTTAATTAAVLPSPVFCPVLSCSVLPRARRPAQPIASLAVVHTFICTSDRPFLSGTCCVVWPLSTL